MAVIVVKILAQAQILVKTTDQWWKNPTFARVAESKKDTALAQGLLQRSLHRAEKLYTKSAGDLPRDDPLRLPDHSCRLENLLQRLFWFVLQTPPTSGGLNKMSSAFNELSYSVEVLESAATPTSMGCCDDGSNENITSPSLEQNSIIKRIGKMKSIPLDKIRVAIRGSEEPAVFGFSRTWCKPRPVPIKY